MTHRYRSQLKIICLTLICFLLFSCSSEIVNDGTRPDIESSPINNLDTDGSLFEFTSVTNYFTDSPDTQYKEWEAYIEDTFGIEVVVFDQYMGVDKGVLLGPVYSAGEYEYIVEEIEKGNIKGLLRIGNLEILYKLAENDMILPVDPYLVDNENWQRFPRDWKMAYGFDNHIWAFPFRYKNSTSLRIICDDWLDSLNLETPSTISEFYEAMFKFTYNDPDNDAIDNTYGATHSGLMGLEDIFASFDVRLNRNGSTGPVWNPNTELWEDSFLKDELSKCMTFIRKCISENLLRTDLGDQFIKGYAGSCYRGYMDIDYAERYMRNELGEDKGFAYILGLSHIIDKNITCTYTDYSYPVVLVKNSDNPYSTVNIYVDVFLSDFDAYLAGRYGLPKSIESIESDYVVYKMYDENGIPNRWPGIVAQSPVFDISQSVDILSEKTSELMKRQDEIATIIDSSGLCYKYNMIENGMNFHEDAQLLSSLQKLSSRCIQDILFNDVNIEEARKEYLKASKKYGMEEYIDELNSIANQ